MKQIKPFFISLFFCMILSVTSFMGFSDNIIFSAPSRDFTGDFELTFFNKSGEGFLGETFRRYHLLTFEYEDRDFIFGAAYNWWDTVEGATSVHNLTPWMLRIQYKPASDWKADVEYWYVRDLQNKGTGDSQAFRVMIERDWQLASGVMGTLRLSSGNNSPFTIGGEIGFKRSMGQIIAGWNMLSVLDEHYINSGNTCLHAGMSIPISAGVELKVIGYHLLNQDLHPTKWVKSTLQFDLW